MRSILIPFPLTILPVFSSLVEGLPIPAGQSWNGVATSIILPKTLEPSLPESISPLIIRTYKLKISLLTDGG
jgi:hypothetical protein